MGQGEEPRSPLGQATLEVSDLAGGHPDLTRQIFGFGGRSGAKEAEERRIPLPEQHGEAEAEVVATASVGQRGQKVDLGRGARSLRRQHELVVPLSTRS